MIRNGRIHYDETKKGTEVPVRQGFRLSPLSVKTVSAKQPRKQSRSNPESTSHIFLILRPRPLARPVLILPSLGTDLQTPVLLRKLGCIFLQQRARTFGPALSASWPSAGFCPDGLLGFPLAALEQMLASLLNSAVAPPTGVASVLAELLEVWSDEGVPRPQLVEARGHGFASIRRRWVWPHPLPWSVRVVLAQGAEHVRQLL